MDKNLLKKIVMIKRKYEQEGFIILGVFGSYARGDDTPESDIDILYDMTENFYNKYPDLNKIIESLLGEINEQFK